MKTVYHAEILAALPRVLALFDRDQSSPSWGTGDRRHWAWGLSDFANGTFQGAANGLARLLVSGTLPKHMATASVLRRIEAIFNATERIRRKDGSFEEAFPHEGSYCVTALVAYDLLSAVEVLATQLSDRSRSEKLASIGPAIRFLEQSDETHAFISNHLATAVAALTKWEMLTNERSPRAAELLDRILTHQSKEGWYCEYGGADPGYQSLCTYYLADVLRITGNGRLAESLEASVRFLWHFAHPDGSFGGLYGSRNTRFFYPAGFEFLAHRQVEAAALAAAMRRSIAKSRVVTLAAMDEPNLIPMFNSYCWAAAAATELPDTRPIPCSGAPFRRHWPEAGILVDRGPRHYTIVGTRKGGVHYHFAADSARVDPGLVYRENGSRFSTQALASQEDVAVDGDEVVVSSAFRAVKRRLPQPWQFLILRLLNITVMRNPTLREWVKRRLVDLLISPSGAALGLNRRRIRLGEEPVVIDEPQVPRNWRPVPIDASFTAIHMASQGYWQAQDDE